MQLESPFPPFNEVKPYVNERARYLRRANILVAGQNSIKWILSLMLVVLKNERTQYIRRANQPGCWAKFKKMDSVSQFSYFAEQPFSIADRFSLGTFSCQFAEQTVLLLGKGAPRKVLSYVCCYFKNERARYLCINKKKKIKKITEKEEKANIT